MGDDGVRWFRRPAAVAVGSLLVSLLAALVANLSLELWHSDGDLGHVTDALTGEFTLFLLDSLVVWLVLVLVTAILGRLWLSIGIILVLTGLLGFADQRKLQVLTEPLYPSDLTVGVDPGFLSAMVGAGVMLAAVVLCLGVVVGAGLLGRFLARRFPRPDRRTNPRLAWGLVAGRVVLALAAVASLAYVMQFNTPGNRIRAVYDGHGAQWRPWNQSMNYTVNGVVAGMLYNLPTPAMNRPAGYSEATMRRLVAKYSDVARSVNRSRDSHALDDVNVVSVLSESFSDPTRYEPVRLAEDPIPFTRHLLTRTTSGRMMAQKFGGGTADTEFEVLTGMSNSQFRPQLTTPYQMLVPNYTEFPSALRYFEGRGMSTMALHSFTSALYRRAQVYPIFGFDHMAFEDDMTHRATIDRSDFISDEATFQEALSRLRSADGPTFMNVVTMQNHYPQAGRYLDPIPSTGMADPRARANLEHYARGLRHSDQALADFLKGLRASGEKTVLLFYGDHLPPLWGQTGMPLRMRHETPFLVWTDFGKPKVEHLPTTSPVYLMDHVLEAADAPVSPYYALLGRLERQVPAMMHDFYIDPQNRRQPWSNLPASARQVLHDYRLVMYDLSVGRRYSEKAMFDLPSSTPTVSVSASGPS